MMLPGDRPSEALPMSSEDFDFPPVATPSPRDGCHRCIGCWWQTHVRKWWTAQTLYH